jgi:hypothetical protein
VQTPLPADLPHRRGTVFGDIPLENAGKATTRLSAAVQHGRSARPIAVVSGKLLRLTCDGPPMYLPQTSP